MHITAYERWPAVAAVVATFAGCATDYDEYASQSMVGMEQEDASAYLSDVGIPFSYYACDEAKALHNDPLAQCQYPTSTGVIWALADDGFYRFGVGSSFMQLYVEFGEAGRVVEVRERPVNTLL